MRNFQGSSGSEILKTQVAKFTAYIVYLKKCYCKFTLFLLTLKKAILCNYKVKIYWKQYKPCDSFENNI